LQHLLKVGFGQKKLPTPFVVSSGLADQASKRPLAYLYRQALQRFRDRKQTTAPRHCKSFGAKLQHHRDKTAIGGPSCATVDPLKPEVAEQILVQMHVNQFWPY